MHKVVEGFTKNYSFCIQLWVAGRKTSFVQINLAKIDPVEPYLIWIDQAMLHLCAKMQQLIKNKYIRGSNEIVVSISANENGYILYWVLSVIVRIYIYRYIGVRERDKISSHTTGIIIGVRLVHGNSISRFFKDRLCFPDSLI